MQNRFPFLRSSRVGVMDSPTSPGSSGLGARMPHYRDEDMGAIHKAASVGNLWRVRQILLFRKSSLNDRDRLSRTALHVACGKGHPRVVRLLVHRHCLLDLCDIDNKTALIYAIQNEQEECATILLDHGADPNKMDIHGNTPLHYAVLGQNTAIVEKLLSCMANMEAKNKDDFTPLSLAKSENKEKMVEILLTRSSKDHQTEGNQQATSEKKEKRRLLKSFGSNNLVTGLQKSLNQAWSKRKSKKVTGLQKSLKQVWNKRKSKKARELAEHEALFRHTLRVACYNGHKRVVSQLACRRRLLDLCDTDNKTALIHAIEYGQEECAAILLEHGADPNVMDIHGNTALHYAVLSQNTTIAEKLVSCMANLEVRNKDDFTPLSLAKSENKEKMVEFLLTKGSKDHPMEGNQQSASEKKEEIRPMKSSDSDNLGMSHLNSEGPQEAYNQSNNVREISEEDSLSSKHHIAVSCPTSDNVVFKVEEEVEEKSSAREVSENVHDGANDDSDRSGLQQQINSEQTDSQQPNDTINENAAFLVDKVEEQEKKTSSKREVSGNMHDGAEDNSDSVGVRQKGNMEQSEKQQVPIKENVNTDSKHRIAVSCPTSDNVVFKVEEEVEEKSSAREVSENVHDGANDDSDRSGLQQQINSEQTDSQQPNDTINENAAFLVDKVEEQEKKTSSKREVSGNMHDGAEDNSDSVGVRQKGNMEQSEKQQVPIKENVNTDRTALHVACGKDHRRVVRRIARRHCPMDLCDIDTKTALIYAIQNEQEEFAITLLDHGANPNIMDIHGNTPLHYAVLGQNTAIVEKLLSCMANTEVRNKDKFTPLSLAKYVNNEKMVEFLETRVSKVHQSEGGGPQATEKETCLETNSRVYTTKKSVFKRLAIKSSNQQATSEKKEKRRLLKYSGINNLVTGLQKSLKQAWITRKSKKVREISEEEPSCSKRPIAVSCPTSDNLVFKVEEEEEEKSSKGEVSKSMYDGADDDSDDDGLSQYSNREQADNQQPKDNINENAVILMIKDEEEEEEKSSKGEVSKSVYDAADDDSDDNGLSQHSSREQTDNQQPNNNINENEVILMNTVEEQEKKTSSKREVSGNMHDGAEDNSDSVGVRQKGNMEQSEKQQVPIKENVNTDRNGFPHWSCGLYSKRRIAVACPTSDNVVFKVEGEKKQRSSIKEVSGNISDGADDDSDRNGLRHQGNSQQTDTQQSNDKINENTVYFMNKVEEKKEQKNSKKEESGNMYDGANDDTDSARGRQINNREQNDKHQFPIVENDDSERLTSQQEEDKRQKADLLNKKNTGQTRKKEEQSIKNVEMNPKVVNTTSTQVMALKTVRRNKVSDSDEKEQRLLRENRMLKNKIAKLTLELDTVKNQNPEKEGKNDSVDIVTVKEKIDHLQKTITETLFQPNAQLEVLRAELTMLSSKLEDEQQNRGRLEAEGDSHRSGRATVVQDHEHCQTSKGDLQLDAKKEKEELICSQGKNKSDMSNLKCDIIEIFSQKFSILENKVNRLEIELHHTRDALRERAVVLEDGERAQSQTQCRKKEIENVSQKEQGKVNADTGKQESLQERLSHLQSENKLLQQQLERAHYKSEKKGKAVIRIQDQIVDTIKILPANSKKQGLMLNETCEELIHESHLLKESRLQYENDKAESDAVVRQLQGELADTQRKLRQLQGELADTQRKLSMKESSLKVEAHHCLCSHYKIQELQRELDESRSQCQRQKEELKKYIDLNIFLQQRLHEEMKKKSDLEKPMARFQEPLNEPKRNLNKELSFDRDFNPSLIEMKMKTDRLIQETEELIAASTCNHSPEDNTDQLEEEMKELQKKCDEMTSRRAWSKQEIIRVQRQMQINRTKHLEELQRLDRIGQCARPDIAYRREQIRQFYQDFFPL